MKKRLLSILVTVCTIATILPIFGGTALAADTVTRSEWISRLVETFSMTVENDDNMPDNYFSDISEDDSYYRDILLAVEFGVIDLEAGEAFEPDKDATREFAAQTLNSCLMFQLDEGAEYTYSEADSVTYPDDIQIAVNRGWFALSGKNFLPEQAVTSAEADAMIADAVSIISNDSIDENYESTYEFADGVKEIPETVDAKIGADNTVVITDYNANISVGDVFVVYTSGFPVTLKATGVETSDNITTITTTKDGLDNTMIAAESEGIIDIDIEQFIPEETTSYSIINTSEPNAQSEDLVIELASVTYKDGKLKATQKVSVGKAAAGSITFELNNLKLHHKLSAKRRQAEAYISGDATITSEIKFDFGEYAGIPSSITLGSVPFWGVGSISLSAEYSLDGGMSMVWTGDLEAGFSYNNGDFRIIKNFTKKSTTFTAEANIQAGLRLSALIDLGLASGSVFASIGVKMSANIKAYDEGSPATCATFKGYLYATIGASATVFGERFTPPNIQIYNESNSPIKVVYHYEDGKQVSSCSRGQSLAYTTSPSSRYFNPSPSYGQGSYGGGGSAEPVVIWEYSTDNDGNATITKYRGNASAVVIPEKIDGHTVIRIGDSAFEGNNTIRTISISNTVTQINRKAFRNCSKLNYVALSNTLNNLGYQAFGNCTALSEIEIPKTLTSASYDANYRGPFTGSGVKTATFEEGTTQIAPYLFYGAGNLEKINFADTILRINTRAFEDCISLKSLDMPDTITNINDRAFRNCTNLSDVTLSKSLNYLGFQAFGNCTALSEIEIPKTLTSVGYDANYRGPFTNCGVKSVTFEEGSTQVVADLFYGAYNLEQVTLLDTMVKIGSRAFFDCSSLKQIFIPNTISKIEANTFKNCYSLNHVQIPLSVTSIGDNAFENCTSLTTIKIPESITNMGNYVFAGSGLEKVDILPILERLPDGMYSRCANLTEANIPSSVKNIGSNIFSDCDKLIRVNMPESLEVIGNRAFYDCDSLETINFSNNVTSIGNEICYSCDALKDVTFGKYITTIPDSAFRQCQSLETITLPRFCTTVAANAFAEDVKLASAYVPVSVSKIETNSFSYPAKMTMYGKSGSYAEEYAKSRDVAFNAVNAPITSIKYADSNMSIGRNATVRPQLNIDPAFDTSVVTFSTSDDKILTVSDTGLVKGVNYGTATITATADSGKSTSIEITVLKTADRLELDKTSLSLEAGQTENLTVTMTPADAADKLKWSSSNTSVATVDGNGKVAAVGVGTAVITVTAAYSGVSASCTVEVVGDVTITASAGEHGKITPSGSVSAKSNAKTTFTITPDYGYVVKDMQVNGASVGAVESYTFNNLSDNATIHADFAAVNVSYENGDVVISSEAALDNLKLIIADYDSNGAMKDCKIKTVTTSAGAEYRESVSSAANQKIMLWSGLDTMRPIWICKG